ncbi:hypothetical protein ILUMI_16464 [Ignelater luminosus]|uniref:Carboxylesterase type B domain-containing protein n=1 Tax=Ignelater luminosus TaxID=2038154 RepID=A0A8K0G870_IGNLU|nr:hypothetical protein ILUMI_16464 [Ignelater luminosus]
MLSPEDKLPKSDERIKDLMVDFVTSFAKNGQPISNGITWERVTDSNEFRYLFIHNDEVKMVAKHQLAPVEFWESLPLKEYDNVVGAFSGTPFTSIIENKLPGAFITDYPHKLLKSGNITDVPWITGATTEGEITGIVALKFQFEDLNER